MAWQYSEKTKELFVAAVHGKEGSHLGEIDEPDGVGEHGSIACGDALRFTFRVDRHATDPMQDVIVQAKYLTFGCTSAIAASEALCAIIEEQHLTPVDALKVTNEDIVAYLDGLPEQKIHCSVMGAEALEAAVFNWAQKRGVNLASLGIDIHSEEQEEGRIVCKCFSLSEPYLRRKIRELNLTTIPEITNAIKAGGGCMACHHTPGGLQDLLDEEIAKRSTTAAVGDQAGAEGLTVLPSGPQHAVEAPDPIPGTPSLGASSGDGNGQPPWVVSTYRYVKDIEKAIDSYIRPMLEGDGGNIDLVDVKGFVVYVTLTGACANCAGANRTLKMLVERHLKESVDERIRVIQV